MKNKFMPLLAFEIMNKKGFFKKLLDKNDPEIAASNFFVILLLCVGILLLIVPLFSLVIESWYNHTITTDLSGMAAYIAAVTSIFTIAGLTKLGVHYTDNKYPEKEEIKETCNPELIEESSNICEERCYGTKYKGD